MNTISKIHYLIIADVPLRDLPPSLQQGVGFGICINIGGGKNRSLPSALLNGMPCSVKPGGGLVKLGANQGVGRGWIGGGSGKSLPL